MYYLMVELQLAARLGPKCQVVIPKAVRDALHVGPSDEVVFRVRDDQIVIERKTGAQILEEFLNAAPKRRPIKPGELKRRYREQIERRLQRSGL